MQAQNDTAPAGTESFSIPNLGGWSTTSSGTETDLKEGYGRISAETGSTTPSGIAIFGFRRGGVLIAEAGVPATELVQEGRIFAEVNGPVDTGLAIANPNDAPATIDFYFTDTEGVRFGEDSFELGAHEQIADFLNETPFNGGDTVLGTFTFTSSLPIAVIALRGFTNRDGEFLMTTLPVAPLATPLTPFTTDTANTGTVYFPHFADGRGWATQVILVNPTFRTITGTVQFLGQGSETTAAAPAVRTLEDGRTGSSFDYSIPPNGSYRIVTSNPSGGVSVGSVRAIPDNGHRAPSGLVIFSFTDAGKTVLEAGVPALAAGSAFRVYVESSGTPEQIGSIRTGLAITNAADTANTVTLEVTNLDGTLAAPPGTLTIPPSGQVSRFIDEFFDSLPPHFSGVLRVTSTAEVAIVGLRLRYNNRGELKMTTTPPSDETGPSTMADRFFPHIVDSAGWSTQFILFSGTAGQASSGTLSFIDTAGAPWDLPTESSVLGSLPPSGVSPSFASGSGPGNQTYTVGTAIDTLTLPEASGGNGTLSYHLTPSVPGLTFDADTRQLNGTPSTAASYTMTYTVTDEDGDSDTLNFAMTVNADSNGVSSSPPDWVFAGNVPDAHRLALREEMEAVRTWFYEQYGVAATGFTVLVGTDSEALTPVFNEVVGPGPIPYSPGGVQVAFTAHRGAVMLINYAGRHSVNGEKFLSLVQHSIAHEYFHVLQGQLASGFAQLQNGKIGVSGDKGPFWLVEGLAQYADYVYTPSRPGRRPFLGDRYHPYKDVVDAIGSGALTLGDLVKLEDRGNVQGGLAHPNDTYAMAFLASTLLVDQADEEASYVKYWQFLHDRPTWQQAFEEAFGIGVDDFYKAFEEWLPSQIAAFENVTINVLWPDMEANPPILGERLSIGYDELFLEEGQHIQWLTTAYHSTAHFTIMYPAGIIWSVTVSLWWSDDQITKHRLGWYKDGELTDQYAEATPIKFTGSYSIDWKLPAHPNTLPRLESRPR